MNKEQVDEFFQNNWSYVREVVERNSIKCVTANKEDITSEVYLICIDKCEEIKEGKIKGYISNVTANTYRWKRSQFNIRNKSQATEMDVNNLSIVDESNDHIELQRLDYAINKYMFKAEPHEKRLCDLYVKSDVRSIRKLKSRLGVSFHGAVILLKEFKHKIKQYERESEIEETA